VSGQLPAPAALLPGEIAPITLGRRLGWPQSRSGQWKREKSLAPVTKCFMFFSSPCVVRVVNSSGMRCARYVPRMEKQETQFWLEDRMDGESSRSLSVNGWIILKYMLI
jgi:hypothetical protein